MNDITCKPAIMARNFFIVFFGFFFTVIGGANDGFARSSGWQGADYAQMRLLADVDEVTAHDDRINLLLEIKMQPGWHTYWQYPGDSGLPPVVEWRDLPEAIGETQMYWPAPQRFDENGFTTFGYVDQVKLPIRMDLDTQKLTDMKGDLALQGALRVMVCHEICVPQKIDFELPIPYQEVEKSQKGRNMSAFANDVMQGFDQLPHQGNLDDLRIENLAVGLQKIVVSIADNRGIDPQNSDIFIAFGDHSFTAQPVLELNEDKQSPMPRSGRYIIQAPAGIDNLSQAFTGQDVHITFTNRGRAIEKTFSF